MNLFRTLPGESGNLLPYDGVVEYHGCVLPLAEANKYFRLLLDEIDWKHDELVLYGKRIVTKRQVAWYGDQPFRYSYSKSVKFALPWTPTLLALKSLVEQSSGENYNSCLLNLYHQGEVAMAWHSDDEPELKTDGAIASLSLGAERKFNFKHKTTDERVSMLLEHGSLLVMKGQTQRYWQHALPPTKTISLPRVNLTFRTIES